MGKYAVGLIALILIGGGAYYWFMADRTQTEVPQTQAPTQMATSTYATSTYSIVYPNDFTKDESYFYDQFSGKPIYGVKFSIPLAVATGTNLSSTSYLSVEQLPRARKCSGDIYLPDDVKASDSTENGVLYSVATSTGAAAGSLYEEMVYAFPKSSPCTAVRYYIRFANMGNFEPGTVREFDRGMLLSALDAIRVSLHMTSPSSDFELTP